MNEINFDSNGLIPAIVQNAINNEILMLAWVNAEALKRTSETGDVHFWSRSRKSLWHKGATSGNYLRVKSILLDCDEDAILFKVIPEGPACHTGAETCFHTPISEAS
jgi:phosphoribosyl-AMP cyclohydrolase